MRKELKVSQIFVTKQVYVQGRVVIDVRKDANANVILNNLYKHTPLQTSFGVNMIAL